MAFVYFAEEREASGIWFGKAGTELRQTWSSRAQSNKAATSHLCYLEFNEN